MRVNEKAVSKNYRKYDGRIMFPSSHDIVDIPEIKEACHTVLGKLLAADNRVLITSKPDPKIVREICEEFGEYKSHIQFRFSITSNNPQLLSFWEPSAPTFSKRIESLRYSFENDFDTSISIEPYLDYDLCPLIEAVSPFSTGSIWIGKMNYIPRINVPLRFEHEYEKIRRNYTAEHIREIVNKHGNNPKIRFKDTMKMKQ